MDRKLLIDLLQDGMRYSQGKHRFWISRCFEITVHPEEVVELNEYEGFLTEKDSSVKPIRQDKKIEPKQMFHVGRSILDLKDGRLVEEIGSGWDALAHLPERNKKT